MAGSNFSVSDAANCTDLYYHRSTARVLMPLAYAIVSPLGLLGNALALHVILSNRAKINSTTLYSANLVVSDILFSLSLPLRAVYYGLGFHWPMGETLCKITALLFYVNTYSGVNFMTCLAVDRFVAIVLPLRLSKLRKVKNVRYVCLAVWLVVLAQTLPLLGMPMTHREPDGTVTCMEYPNFERHVEGLPYMLIGAVVLGYGIPVMTILGCYSLLVFRLRLAEKGNQLTERSGRSRKAMGVIAGVVLVFLVCFSPYHLDILQFMVRKLFYETSCDELRAFQVSLHVTVCLMNLNACLDPFVYFFACKGYKKKILQMMKLQMSTSFSSAGRTSHDSSCPRDARGGDGRHSTRVHLNSIKNSP
ncbi:G-protein coupled receptor 183-B [Chanos chanos]|uniref:G-protein coupled receptor 183-B n=1 Tax=Chanos chanos TaxID=29144 RepID=A0A6J2VWH0_CHACN|nr:G-protein coupled receptor 183-B-like [Chanos chanos]